MRSILISLSGIRNKRRNERSLFSNNVFGQLNVDLLHIRVGNIPIKMNKESSLNRIEKWGTSMYNLGK